jgi:hypothetical protein
MKKIFIIALFLSVCFFAQSQTKNTVTENYILQYRKIAIENENQYGIPASITLAQGIIESGSGRSTLAKQGNNHFGIKCHNSWTGKRMYQDDDEKGECFRVYDNAEQSYTDHSLFLTKMKRYAFLFKIDKTDYKSWAKGLKQAGYATNPNYSNLLINIIELYELNNVKSKNFYLLNNGNNTSNNNTTVKQNNNKQEKPQIKKHRSLMEKLFGNTSWYKRRHETEQQKKRREMDEKIRKMIDEKDVQRNDFEIDFE